MRGTQPPWLTVDGELPRSWGRLKSLKVLRLARNRNLTGGVPDDWSGLVALEELDLRNNKLGGKSST